MNALNIAHSPSPPAPKALGIVLGRFMLPDSTEHACQVIDITLEGASFLTDIVPPVGMAIVAYLDEIGRVEAVSGKSVSGGFNVNFTMKGPRLERLQQRILLLQSSEKGSPDDRRHARFEPTERQSQISLPDGRVYPCEVIDISVSGAAIKCEVMPSVGNYLMLGKMRGRVVRYIETGVAIEFVKQLDRMQLPAVAAPAPL